MTLYGTPEVLLNPTTEPPYGVKKVEKGLKTANLLPLSPTLFQLKSLPVNTSKALLPRATLVQEEVNQSISHFTVTGAITEFRVHCC